MIAIENQKLNALRTQTCLALLVLMLTTASAIFAAPVANNDGVTFILNDANAQAVFIAGDFNGWNASDLPLASGGDGNWSITMKLSPGAYEYKFVVDGDWREDASNPEKKSDPFGGSNSLVTIQADGSIAGVAAGTAAVAAPTATDTNTPDTAVVASTEDIQVGAPREAEGGIAFTYKSNDAARVNLAGTFNSWNADDTPLSNDGDGNWIVVRKMDAGPHEYKFVVDGNWLADPENPDTHSDPYGGVNSIITVDSQGKLTATVASSDGGNDKNNNMNAQVNISGRYLTRFEYAKNVSVDVNDEAAVDPRYRLQRPTQSVDLNFDTEVSDMTSTFVRLRLDSDQNIIQNNVAAFLDEANIEIQPENFALKAYWNQEVFSGEDLLKLGGDIDLPGTIMHDHLDYGKGSAGVLFVANPLGIRTHLFFANVHNLDYYNDPELYDNIGQDRVSLRFSKKFGKFELGTPIYAERALVWLDFGDLVSLPSTGIPSLDEHRANTGDTSTWYEVDNYIFNGGLDLSFHATKSLTFGVEALYQEAVQEFTTGNESGQNNTNGAIEVPFLERDQMLLVGQIDLQTSKNSHLKLQYQTSAMNGGDPDQRRLEYSFLPQETANKQVLFTIDESPAVVDRDSAEIYWNWQGEDRGASLWLRRAKRDLDFAPVGQTSPHDPLVEAHSSETYYLAGSVNTGRTGSTLGHFEFEAGYDLLDHGVASLKRDQLELIFRYDRDLSRNVGFIADLRFTTYHSEADASETTDDEFINLFAGFRYTPIRQFELVLAYGVDPLDYSIDYAGRQLGRYNYRQNYLFSHPGATVIDAENHLEQARVFILRAQLLF